MMAHCCTVVSQAEISSLKDTLCAQQKLLQQLYNELEAEREAAATAASEALSVILRLQGEKAAVKMEAEQYKRLAEERLGYAEESFAMIEDMITEKEMEVAELDYQVQTYRYQLMSMGFDVPAADDTDHLFHRHDCLAGKMALLERERSTSTDLEFASDSDRKADEGISCFAEQIKALQQRVKEISGENISGFMIESQSPSMSSHPSAANLCCLPETETRLPSPRPPTVHDVFEVPQVDHESPNKHKQKEVKSQEDDPEWLTNLLQSVHHENNLCIPSDVAVAFVQPATSTIVDPSESEFKKLERSVEIREEVERSVGSNRAEELELLKEIKEKINELQNEIIILKVKKSSEIDEPSLQPIAEAMFSFWL